MSYSKLSPKPEMIECSGVENCTWMCTWAFWTSPSHISCVYCDTAARLFCPASIDTKSVYKPLVIPLASSSTFFSLRSTKIANRWTYGRWLLQNWQCSTLWEELVWKCLHCIQSKPPTTYVGSNSSLQSLERIYQCRAASPLGKKFKIPNICCFSASPHTLLTIPKEMVFPFMGVFSIFSQELWWLEDHVDSRVWPVLNSRRPGLMRFCNCLKDSWGNTSCGMICASTTKSPT
jgi:hypothetical protein